jgi:hypothetical protein
MKTKRIIINTATLGVAGLIAGCASTGNDKAASTASALTKSSAQIANGNSLIDQTLANRLCGS